MNQLLTALRFYTTGSFQLVVGDVSKASKATVCRTVHKVTKAIAGLRGLRSYVLFPTTTEDRRGTMGQFYAASSLPGVIGAIDCTHIAIQSSGGDDAEIYRNRKGYFSLNMQLVCDQRGYISDVVARWPGSVHDSTIFDQCHLRAVLETSLADGYLVGDSGYPCKPYLLTPMNTPITAAEKAYNYAQAVARNVIERTNGLLKCRFPCLKYGLRVKLEHALPVIVATVVLHNIAVLLGDDQPPEDIQLHAHIASKRSAGLHIDYDPVQVGPPTAANPIGATGVRRAVINGHFTRVSGIKGSQQTAAAES